MKKAPCLITAALILLPALGFGQTAAKEWTIPFLNCLTGPIASYGELFQWSAERAAAEINAAGGIKGKPVKIVGVDTASDPQKGSTEMARLVKDTLVALGPVPEPVILAAMPIAVEAGMVSITATTSYEYAVKFFPWTVSWFDPTEHRLGVVVAAWAKQHPAMKKVVQFVTNYGPWPGMADAHAKAFSSLGITMLPNVEVPQDAVTFGPLVVKALDQNPDGIVICTFPDKTAKVIQELKNRGWTNMKQILIFSSGDGPDLYSTGGKDLNGVAIYNYINPDISNPRWNAVKAAYSKSHNGQEAPSLLTNYYDAVYMIKEAIEKTGVAGNPAKLQAERKLISDYISNVKGFKGVMFDWDMENGVPTNKPNYIFTIQDGKKVNPLEVR
jgi:branched-chain amino acid transport system substrate-binding protein